MNSQLDTLHAAILLRKLEFVAEAVRLAHKLRQRYAELFNATGVLNTAYIAAHITTVYGQNTIPLNKQHLVVDARPLRPHADEAAGQVLHMPIHPYLQDSDQAKVVTIVCASFFKVAV